MKHSKEYIQIVDEAKAKIREISCQDLHSLLETKKTILIDVRENPEWDLGHLPHAIHLSKGLIERDIHKKGFKKEEQIILYCSGGFRSAIAGANLKQMGYTHVFSLKGGFKEWLRLKLPISV